MRHRETTLIDTWEPLGAIREVYRPSSGAVTSTSRTPKGVLQVKSIDDVVTPGFHALRKCGKFLPYNPLVVRTRTWSNQPATETFRWFGADRATRGEITPYAVAAPGKVGGSDWYSEWIPPLDQDLIDATILAAAANAVGNKWDVLTMLAELGSTVETLHTVSKRFNTRMVQVVTRIKQARKSPAAVYEFLRKEWLMARYGIRPIVYDVISAQEAINRILSEMEFVFGVGKQEDDVRDADGWLNPGTTAGDRRYDIMSTVRRKYSAQAALKLDAPSGIQLDPIVTGYELVPYSFVLDRFINIGAWLSTLTPTFRGHFLGQMHSVKVEAEVSCNTLLQANTAIYDLVATESSASYTVTEYIRVPGSGIPPFPGFNPRINLPFAIDLVALFLRGKRDVYRIANRR